MATEKLRLRDNVRFYVLAFSLILSVAVFAWWRMAAPSDPLFYIRSEQTFGLVAVLYWYAALIISPLGYAIGKRRMEHFEFARRGIGVSAAYFALLHAGVAVWGQLGGFSGLALLPSSFRWSLLGGATALAILLVMAATSFDRVITFMTFRRWKWLHRLVYAGGIVAVLHIWAIGTHIAYSGVQIAAFIALVVLSGLEVFRVATLMARKYPQFQSKQYFYTLALSLWVLWIVLLASIPALVHNAYSGESSSNNQHIGGHNG